MITSISNDIIIHRGGLPPSNSTRQSGKSPRLRGLIWSRPRRIIRSLPLFHDFFKCLYGTPRFLRQIGVWNHPVYTIDSARICQVIRLFVLIRRYIFPSIILALFVKLLRLQQHGDLFLFVSRRQHLGQIPNRKLHLYRVIKQIHKIEIKELEENELNIYNNEP